MSTDNAIEMEGTVTEILSDATFRVRLDNGHTVIAPVSERVSKHPIRIVNGDRVCVEIMPDDITKGEIVYRSR